MRKLQVLVADDDRDFVESMALMLRMTGHEVDTARNGVEAENLFEATDYDIAFLDVRMPGQNGVSALQKIRRMRPHARVVMMTGYSVKDLLDRAVAEGAFAVLHKPFDWERIFSLVRGLKPVRILVADSDPAFAESVREGLEWHGYRTAAPETDGGETESAEMGDSAMDVVVCDVALAEDHGEEFPSQLRQWGDPPPALILVASPDQEFAARRLLQSVGAGAVLLKPFAMKILLEAVERLTA